MQIYKMASLFEPTCYATAELALAVCTDPIADGAGQFCCPPDTSIGGIISTLMEAYGMYIYIFVGVLLFLSVGIPIISCMCCCCNKSKYNKKLNHMQ